jgi:hypothetical protein
MSSLIVGKLCCFRAPLSISKHKVATSGSWTLMPPPTIHDILISPQLQTLIRLHTWKQQYRNTVFDLSLSWISTATHNQYLELHVWKCPIPVDIDGLVLYIQSVLNMRRTKIFQLYQHMHPGAVRSESVAASVGNEGANQSD